MLTICCFYWEDKARQRSYRLTPEDVRIWDRMIARNLTIPHRRICVTHRPDLIDFMDTVSIDPAKHVPGTCTVKLMVHKPDIAKVLGDRICLMDIDCVVTGNLDEIMQAPGEWVGWHNP